MIVLGNFTVVACLFCVLVVRRVWRGVPLCYYSST
jgi:hypothetical protein